jgi:hypothetical protein
MAGVIVFLVVAFGFFLAGMLNIALSPVLWSTLTRIDANGDQIIASPAMVEAGFDEESEALFLVWKYSPLLFFFCCAIFAFQAIRRRGQSYG